VHPALAAAVTGVVCGLLGVVLIWLAGQGCESVRGVGTCGGFGLTALIGILAIVVLLGGALLRLWGVGDPLSTSFLGASLVAVIAMLFFLDATDSVWMVLVIPVLTALAFVLSWWVTATFVEQAQER